MTKIAFGPVQPLDSFTYSGETTFSVAVRYLYSADFNGDGLDELVFAGFETQLNTPENYTNTKLAVYGWQNGVLTNQTNQWLPNGTNAVEGVGDIGFGDFNGNGRVDLFLSAYTDMDHPVNAYALMNQGTYFEKVNLGQAIWQHGVAVADINNDGFSDVYAAGYDRPVVYLGSPTGLIQQAMWPDRFLGGGSGVALADFIGDGSISMITSDGWIDGVFGTGLYSFGPNLEPTLLSVLPQSRMGINGHDVRVKAFDFSNDGLMDAIVFTTAGAGGAGAGWTTSSEIQFLENQGNGTFLDVTPSRLTGYDRTSSVSYSPYFVDINRDGLVDIFLSEAGNWDYDHQSTAILLAQQDGSYIETGRDELSAYVSEPGAIAGLVRGPNNQFYLVVESHQFGSGNATVKAVALYFPERDGEEVNDAPTGSVSILGTARQGQVLTASNTLADIDGLGATSYQWRANGIDISGATGATYILTQAEVGKTVSVMASYTDGGGTAEAVTSGPTGAVQADTKSVEITARSQTIDAIGLTPDGRSFVIKIDGVSQTVSRDALLDFADKTVAVADFIRSMDPIPVFSSVVNGKTIYVLPDKFTGPASLNLDYQLIDDTPNAVVTGSDKNDFIKLSNTNSIGKAVDAGAGDDVIDGGVGSAFVTGGAGSNTFFLDGRASGVSWSTITDFKLDVDKATIWGWKSGVSQVARIDDNGGAPGYEGVTLHFVNLLPSEAGFEDRNSNWNSLTFSGKTLADFGARSIEELNAQITAGSNPTFMTGVSVDEYGAHGYLYLS